MDHSAASCGVIHYRNYFLRQFIYLTDAILFDRQPTAPPTLSKIDSGNGNASDTGQRSPVITVLIAD